MYISDPHDVCLTGDHDCHENAVCHSTYTSYSCQCKKGYSGDGYDCQCKLLQLTLTSSSTISLRYCLFTFVVFIMVSYCLFTLSLIVNVKYCLFTLYLIMKVSYCLFIFIFYCQGKLLCLYCV